MPYELPVIGFARNIVGGLSSVGDAWGAPARNRAAKREADAKQEREGQRRQNQEDQTRLDSRRDAVTDRLPAQALALQNVTDRGRNAEHGRELESDTHRTGLARQLFETTTKGRISEIGAGSQARINEARVTGELANEQLRGKLKSLLELNHGLGGIETGQLGMFVGSDPNNPALKQILDNASSLQRNYLDSAERIAQLSRPSAVRQGFDVVKDLGMAFLASRI